MSIILYILRMLKMFPNFLKNYFHKENCSPSVGNICVQLGAPAGSQVYEFAQVSSNH